MSSLTPVGFLSNAKISPHSTHMVLTVCLFPCGSSTSKAAVHLGQVTFWRAVSVPVGMLSKDTGPSPAAASPNPLPGSASPGQLSVAFLFCA